MLLKTLLLSTLAIGIQGHKTPAWISLFNNSDVHCRNTDAYNDTYTAFTNDACKVLQHGRPQPVQNRRVLGRSRQHHRVQETSDCWEDEEPVWHIYKDLGHVSDDSHFCQLLRELSPNDPEPYFAGVKGVGTEPGIDLSSLDLNHIPPIP